MENCLVAVFHGQKKYADPSFPLCALGVRAGYFLAYMRAGYARWVCALGIFGLYARWVFFLSYVSTCFMASFAFAFDIEFELEFMRESRKNWMKNWIFARKKLSMENCRWQFSIDICVYGKLPPAIFCRQCLWKIATRQLSIDMEEKTVPTGSWEWEN